MRLSYEGDQAQAQEWLGKSRQELDRLRSRMAVGQREQGTFAHALSDTAYVYGGILPGGYEWMHIITSPGVSAEPSSPMYKPTTPDFISGATQDNRIVAAPDAKKQRDRLQAFIATQPSVTMHAHELPATHCSPERLAVEAGPTFQSMLPQHSPFKWAQTTVVKPTLYSGKMRAVVQALLGFGLRTGKMSKDGILSIYDLAKPKLDQEKLTQIKPTASQWERDTLKHGVQVWYDFRFSRTHGITTAADGKPWLVEISQGRGIVAMPLPLWPLTTTGEFFDKVIAMGDLEAETMILELGGFPTGEHFPVATAAFDAYVKAGRIIQLASKDDLKPFYDNLMYGSGVGWAFNMSGSEAHNTAYNYGGFSGHQLGVHYACNLQIGDSRDTNSGSQMQKDERAKRRASLKAKFDVLRNSKDFVDTFEAAIWKIDHASDSNLLTMEAAIGSLHDKMQELVGMTITPLATGSASCGKMGEGFLWNMARPVGQPQIKFPEPSLGYILSHDFRPDDGFPPAERATPVLCDTTMFVFFKDDELAYVKYYFNPATHTETQHEDDFEECMYAGSWHSLDVSDTHFIPAGFYTSEFDDRRSTAGSTRDTRIVGKDIGWISVQIGDDPEWPAHGWVTRDRGYLHTTTTVVAQGDFWRNAIAIPLVDREAYYYAYFEGFTSRSTFVGQSTKVLGDPNFAEYWRVFGGYTHPTDQSPGGCGTLTLHRKVQYLLKNDPLRPCQDIVDEGPWLQMCEDVEHASWAITPPSSPGTTTIEPVTRHKRVQFSSSSDTFPELAISEYTHSGGDTAYESGGLFFINSPDEFGDMQAIYATRNSLGDGDLIWLNKEPNSGDVIVRGGPQLLPDKPPLPTFVGVING